ncbi:hypothetical protein GW932_05250 [archaeon]|nr:hypothetical protein [archaeon]
MKKEEDKKIHVKKGFLLLVVASLFLFSISFALSAPTGIDGLDSNFNKTKSAASAQMVNISGGYIASFNLTADVQNPRWKAFVGQVIGSFSLSDGEGSTIYDWTLATVTGRVYATRKVAAPNWGSIACATTANLETENANMNHDKIFDNITATFDDATHGIFYVGAEDFLANECTHTVNTYVGGASTAAFEEVALYDGADIVYAAILEENEVGFDGEAYDFQMLVPEDGSPGFAGATPYYLYIELD